VSPAVTASHSGSSSSSSALVALPASATDAAASSLPPAPPAPVESVSRRAIKEATGGLGGSIFSACCVYPIDLVKTRMQLPNSPIKSLFGGFATIVAQEGFGTLYTGLGSELVKASLQNFSYFYWYAVFKEMALTSMARAERDKAEKARAANKLAGGAPSGFLHGSNDGSAGAGDAMAELRLHQQACVDASCFCRSEAHLAAHSEAHKRSQIDMWRAKAILHRLHKQEKLRRTQLTAQQQKQNPNTPSTLTVPDVLPRLLPSVSEPSLSSFHCGGADMDDSPYVDLGAQGEPGDRHAGALVTDTAKILYHPTTANSPAPAASGAPVSPVVAATPAAAPAAPVTPQLSIPVQLLLGTVAGCLTQLLVNPVSVIQTRMMTQKKSLATGSGGGGGAAMGFFALAVHIFRSEGIGAFFTGLIPAFILSTNPSIQFLVFDRLKALLLRVLQQSGLGARSLSLAESFVLGATSKIVATLATYPIIVTKTRLQFKGGSGGGGAGGGVVYTGVLDVLLRTIKYEGVWGLYAGMQAQLLKSVLGAALMYAAKERLAELAAWIQRKLAQARQQQPQQPPPPPATAPPTAPPAALPAEDASRRLSATVQVPPAVRLTQR